MDHVFSIAGIVKGSATNEATHTIRIAPGTKRRTVI